MLGAVALVGAGFALFFARDPEGERATSLPAPPEPGPNPALDLSAWPRMTDGSPMPNDAQMALILSAISLAGDGSFRASRNEFTVEAVNAWEAILLRTLGERPSRLSDAQEAQARRMLEVLRASRSNGSLAWSFEDFQTLQRLIPPGIVERVDDDAELLLGRPL